MNNRVRAVKISHCFFMIFVFAIGFIAIIASGGGGDDSNSDGPDEPTADELFWDDAFYSLDETSGATAYNSSFDSLDGKIVGATRDTGKVNNALSFALDLPSYVEFSLYDEDKDSQVVIDFPNNEISIEAWINFTYLYPNETYHFFGDQRYGIKSFRIDVIDSQFRFTLFTNSTGSESIELIRSNFEFDVDTWYHFAFTYNGEEARIYINGEINSTSRVIASLHSLVNTLYMGGFPVSAMDYNFQISSFPGYIDEFLFSQNLRTDEEIRDYYELTR